jgi:hypothetical protein
MRTIAIKEVKTADGSDLDYLELCAACLKAPAQGGYDIKSMEVRLQAVSEFPVVKRIQGHPKPKPAMKEVTVSEEVYQELNRCVATFRWGVADQVFIDFVKYIAAVGKQKPKADKKK